MIRLALLWWGLALLGLPAAWAQEEEVGATLVSGGPSVTWFLDRGPRFGGIDAQLVGFCTGRVMPVGDFSTFPFSYLPGLGELVGSHLALRGGADLRLGPRARVNGLILGLRVGGQSAKAPNSKRKDPSELSVGAGLRVGYRLMLRSGSILTIGAGVQRRFGSWAWVSPAKPTALSVPVLLPLGELSMGQRF